MGEGENESGVTMPRSWPLRDALQPVKVPPTAGDMPAEDIWSAGPSIQFDAVGRPSTCQIFAQPCCQDFGRRDFAGLDFAGLGRSREEPAAMFDLTRLLNVLSSRAGTTADFQRMLEWKLLRGSHEFPGPDGGTCINEAAIVAAGYPYRPIYRVRDLPASFSRPIALFALCLNDTLEDEMRQELLVPFVTRLAGSADVSKIEMARAELMLRRIVTEILPSALARAGDAEIGERRRALRTPTELVAIAKSLRNSESSVLHRPLTSALEHAADAGRQWLSGLPTEVVFCSFSVLRDIA